MLFTSCLIIFYGYLPGLYEWIRKCVIDNVKYESFLKNCCGRMDDIYISNKQKTDKIKQMWAKTFLMKVLRRKSPRKISYLWYHLMYFMYVLNKFDIGSSHYIANFKKSNEMILESMNITVRIHHLIDVCNKLWDRWLGSHEFILISWKSEEYPSLVICPQKVASLRHHTHISGEQ